MAEALVSTLLVGGSPAFTALGVTKAPDGFIAELIYQQTPLDTDSIVVEHHTADGVTLHRILNPGIPHVGLLVGPPVGESHHHLFISEETNEQNEEN